MLRFFRKMRKALIPENRFGRYFFYAVGEIVLVVIGILIALQVNNWNENRKLANQRVILLQNLKTDFEQNLDRINSINIMLADRESYARQILFLLKELPNKVDTIKTVMALERAGFVFNFLPALPTYNEMRNSGTLILIKNNTLKQQLANYVALLENNVRIEDRNSIALSEYNTKILKYMDPDFGYVNFLDTNSTAYTHVHFDLKAMAADPEIRYLLNNIINKSISEASYKKRLAIPMLNRILESIDNELQN